MPKLIMMKGLPACGKSTKARELVDAAPSNSIKRVNKDNLRDMMDNGRWSKGSERIVLDVRDYIIRTALLEGKNVVVDDTNLDPKHEKTLREIAKSIGAQFKVEDLTSVPLEECIRRDASRLGGVGEDVIRDMHRRYLSSTLPSTAISRQCPPSRGMELAVIVDIDGTVAHHDGVRGHHDYARVNEDEPIHHIIDLLQTLCMNYTLVFVSGRPEYCREKTEAWLDYYEIPWSMLFMRREDDFRNDAIVKEEIYEQHIKPHWDVQFVLDDRDRVVKMWREELNLPCLQVNYGDF